MAPRDILVLSLFILLLVVAGIGMAMFIALT